MMPRDWQGWIGWLILGGLVYILWQRAKGSTTTTCPTCSGETEPGGRIDQTATPPEWGHEFPAPEPL
jgi:hypothetical protein